MHELAVTEAIVRQAREEAERLGLGERVQAVHLAVGALTTFVPASLTFYFDILKKGTTLEKAELVIKEIPVRGRCPACGAEATFEALPFLCGCCGSPDVELRSGRELEITSLTVEDGTARDGD